MAAPAQKPIARVEGLSHAFGDVVAVRDVALALEPGELLGIVGPDGAGKSTLLRLWTAVIRAKSGTIEIDGRDARRDPESIRGLVGYMPQRFSLYEDLSVDENIRFFSELRLVPREAIAERRARLLAFTRLDRFTDRRAGKLSGGMKQKLGLICTLMHQPRVLFLDEPTNGVDPVSRREFWELLRELLGQSVGLTAAPSIVVSTPYMDEAERCDRVAMMDAGRVRAVGAPEALRRKVGGRVVEVVTPEPARARPVVAAATGHAEITGVAMSGGRLRTRGGDDAAERVRAALAAAGLAADVHVVPPSMEDVFTSLGDAP